MDSGLHLWEIDTVWFMPHSNEYTCQTFVYKSWKDFLDCKPYKYWKPYVLSSWCWKDTAFQLVMISPERFVGMNRVEFPVEKEEEKEIRLWIKNHMPKFWKL
jgi:hypothetical protein